jgi:hypothetical protein
LRRRPSGGQCEPVTHLDEPSGDGQDDRALEPGDRPHEFVAGGTGGTCAVCGHPADDALHDPINRPTGSVLDQLDPANREQVEMAVADALLYGNGRLVRDGTTRLRRVSANDPDIQA